MGSSAESISGGWLAPDTPFSQIVFEDRQHEARAILTRMFMYGLHKDDDPDVLWGRLCDIGGLEQACLLAGGTQFDDPAKCDVILAQHTEAAEKGSALAQFQLGRHFASQFAKANDPLTAAMARMWLNRAIANDSAEDATIFGTAHYRKLAADELAEMDAQQSAQIPAVLSETPVPTDLLEPQATAHSSESGPDFDSREQEGRPVITPNRIEPILHQPMQAVAPLTPPSSAKSAPVQILETLGSGCGQIIGGVGAVVVAVVIFFFVYGWLSGLGQSVRTWSSSRTTTAHAMLTQAFITSDDRPDTATQTPSMRTVRLSGIIDNKDTGRSIDRVRLAVKLYYCPVGLSQPTSACTQPKGDFDKSIFSFAPLVEKPVTGGMGTVANLPPTSIAPGERGRFNMSFMVSDVPPGFFVMGRATLERACTSSEARWCGN